MSSVHAATADPRQVISGLPMRWRQILVIAICVVLNGLDGFDVLSISFASPGIAKDWGIERGALGIVLSAELLGMAVGSFFLGNVADKIGRRPTAIGCLFVMAIGMFGAAHVTSIEELSLLRLITGLGIGGMLACTNAMVAEFANDRWRAAAIGIMAAGYPMGAIAGGAFASSLLVDGTWRDVFTFGGYISAAMLPVLYFLVPETVGHIVQRNPDNALARINRSLQSIGHAPVAALPADSGQVRPRIALSRLMQPDLRSRTLLLLLAYFFHVMTFYYILKWIPKIVVDMGYAPSAAGGVLVWANVGGLIGSLLLSFLTLRFGLRYLMIGTLLMSTVMVVLFGRGQADLHGLAIAAAVAGFFTNAGMAGFYPLMAATFPTEARAGGTGFVIGLGRGGAVLGPVAAGFLFQFGAGLQGVSIAMGLGSLFGALAIIALHRVKRPA
ncbi:MAG: MFS transporter [Novosphingobium sp.]